MNDVVAIPAVKATLKAGAGIQAIVPTTIEEAMRLARAVCIAGLVPDSLKGKTDEETASRVMITFLKGQEVGLPPMAALANIYIINNKPSMYGDGALAVVQAHPQYAGHKEWYEGSEGQDSWIAKCEFYRRESNVVITTYPGQFSWAQAKTANLTRRGPWVSYAARMLKMRARAFGMRDSFADALVGLAIVEEIQDFPEKPATVDTSFLDADEPKVEPTKPLDEQPRDAQADAQEVTVDSKALLDGIKKNFVKIGDDLPKIKEAVEAAEGLSLDEPYQSELNKILEAKRAKYGNRDEDKGGASH